jgi:hypothetical protein
VPAFSILNETRSETLICVISLIPQHNLVKRVDRDLSLRFNYFEFEIENRFQ